MSFIETIKVEDSPRMKGRVIATLYDAHTGEKIRDIESDNLVVTTGKNQTANLLAGANTTSFNFIGVGSSSSAPTVGDVDLILPVSSNQCNDRLASNNIAVFNAYFSSSQANNGSLSECILSTAQSSGVVLSRALFGTQINKTSLTTLTVQWQISVS